MCVGWVLVVLVGGEGDCRSFMVVSLFGGDFSSKV